MRPIRVPFTGLACAVALAGAAHAAEPAASGAAPLPASAVVIDRETGKLRAPTDEERAALSAGFQRDLERLRGKPAARPELVRRADGAAYAVIGTERLELLMAREDENGELVIGHRAEPAAPAVLPEE